jgi:NADH-quinone oxidoreductase subunit N
MDNLIPHIPAQLDDILKSMPWFVPELGLSILFLIVFLSDLIAGKKVVWLTRGMALAGMVVVLFTTLQQLPLVTESHFIFNGMLLLHRTSVCFKLVIDVLAILIIIYIPWDKALRAHFKGLGDLYSIVIASVLGLHLMLMAANLLSIYLAVEMVSLASYLMVAYRSDTQTTTEAGMKYVVFGAVSSAIMLYGISLLYGFSGTLDIFAEGFINNLVHVNPSAFRWRWCW